MNNNDIAIGKDAQGDIERSPKNTIAIGNGAISSKPYELCIRIEGLYEDNDIFEFRTIMTSEEWYIIDKVIERAVNEGTCKIR